jgi:DNA-binding NarL/FixJ family response regulator
MKTVTVLLADDHPAFLSAAMRQLRKVDWIRVVGTACNGIEAVALAEELRPDAVLMDLAMPEMGGLQATRIIKAQDHPPFVVINSHFDDPEHREHAVRSGADGFASKLTYLNDTLPLLERLRDQAAVRTPAAV